MVSDEELLGRLQSLLCQVDLRTATLQGIRRHLEGEFGVELEKKDEFIKHHIGLFLQQCQYPSRSVGMGFSSPSSVNPYYHHPNLSYPSLAQQQQQQYQLQQQQHQHYSNAVQQQIPPATAYIERRNSIGSHNGYEEPSSATVSTAQEGKKRSRAGGLNKVCSVSPELQAIVGEPKLPRTQIVKQLWAYIRANNLQDPNNKRNIICNDALRLVFDTDSTDMFQMNKLLARHIKTIDAKDENVEPNPKRIANDNSSCSDSVSPNNDTTPAVDTVVPVSDSPAINDAAISETDSLAVIDERVPISDSLASFLGTGEAEMPRDEVLKFLNDYIKENNLQDPTDEGMIICDEKLQKLFSCQNFACCDMAKLLALHFTRA